MARLRQTDNNSVLIDLDGIIEDDIAAMYARWLDVLNRTGVAYVVGGAMAVYAYSGIYRQTKDLDVFISPSGVKPILGIMSDEGFEVEVTDTYWLAKVRHQGYLLDCLFGLSNHLTPIDEKFLKTDYHISLRGIVSPLIGIEELIASKLFLIKSYRFDAHDVLHLIHSLEGRIDWNKLLSIINNDGELLLLYLLLFHYVYPGRAEWLPKQLIEELFERVRSGWGKDAEKKLFRGTAIDPKAFEIDTRLWGYTNPVKTRPLVDEQGNPL